MGHSKLDLLTPAEAAQVLGLTPAGIVAMATRGALPAIRTASGRRLFRRRDIERIAVRRAEAESKVDAS
jgi:excisionase family DNA binding protein